ncbi:MAG: RelA/SpoT family protein [Bacteroidales bacterium]
MERKEPDTARVRSVYSTLLRYCRPILTKEDGKRLRAAFNLVLEQNRSQWDRTGEDYPFHGIEVAGIALRNVNLGMTSVIAALLHNILSTTNLTADDIEQQFGREVRIIVEGYHRLSQINTSKISLNSDNFRRLYLALVEDIRVILIKLAHRLYDMRHYDELDKKRQKYFLDEVQHIYIPIAHRLGLYHIKAELEDHWMKHSHRTVYNSIARHIQDTREEQTAYIDRFRKPIENILKKEGFKFEIKGRPKSIHSIWIKMRRQNVGLDQVYDLFAIRIIIDTPRNAEKADCWRVYSIVTDIYPPNPARLRDWISSPKASGYESLHTTVKGPENRWVEVQIRSKRMDEVAEHGLAAHWKYKEGAKAEEQEAWMNRIRDIIENPSNEGIDQSGLTQIKLFSDDTFVFTPEGDLKRLPKGSTVLDFAYEIHTSVGDMCSGARVNGRIVPIRHVLKSGDKVEIITSKSQKPKLDWLSIVVTNKAKKSIRKALKEDRLQEAEIGKEILRRKLRNRKIQFNDVVVDRLIKQYNLSSSTDLYYLIAIEKIDVNDIRKTLSETEEDDTETAKTTQAKESKPADAGRHSGDCLVIDNHLDKLGYELAKCCNPISGDAVFGFVTVGKGITIHRLDCPNARQLLSKYNYRVIDVKWRQAGGETAYLTTLEIIGDDRMGVLNNITQIISNDLRVNMVSLNVDSDENNGFIARIKLSVKDTDHLNLIIQKLHEVKGVRRIYRVAGYLSAQKPE